MSQIDATTLFWAGTVLWIVLWAVFIARLAWLDLQLCAHLTAHHPHRWRRRSWSERLTWSEWFIFQSKEDYGDPAIGARRSEMLTVCYDMLLVLAAMIVWFVVSAAMVQRGP
jgi:hypothetical protein